MLSLHKGLTCSVCFLDCYLTVVNNHSFLCYCYVVGLKLGNNFAIKACVHNYVIYQSTCRSCRIQIQWSKLMATHVFYLNPEYYNKPWEYEHVIFYINYIISPPKCLQTIFSKFLKPVCSEAPILSLCLTFKPCWSIICHQISVEPNIHNHTPFLNVSLWEATIHVSPWSLLYDCLHVIQHLPLV